MCCRKGLDHPNVRPPCGADRNVYSYGVVDTQYGVKPIEPGDWLVLDATGAAVWRHEHFEQVFVPTIPAEGIFS